MRIKADELTEEHVGKLLGCNDPNTGANHRKVLDAPAAFVTDAKQYAGLGISQLDLTPDRDLVEYTELLATIVPKLAEL
jgi:hypothetical protein